MVSGTYHRLLSTYFILKRGLLTIMVDFIQGSNESQTVRLQINIMGELASKFYGREKVEFIFPWF